MNHYYSSLEIIERMNYNNSRENQISHYSIVNSIMKFKESKSIIESRLKDSYQFIISIDGEDGNLYGEIYHSLLKKGEKKGNGMGMEFIGNSFTPLWGDSFEDEKNDYLLIERDSWKSFLSLI